jgi:ATP-dependent RNA helicase DDX24/MAK5
VEIDVLDKLKDRVSLARRIDSISHKQTKVNHEKNWLKQAAADLEIDLDPELVE